MLFADLTNEDASLKPKYNYLNEVAMKTFLYKSDGLKVKGYMAHPKETGKSYPVIMNWFKLSLLPTNITFCTHISPFLITVRHRRMLIKNDLIWAQKPIFSVPNKKFKPVQYITEGVTVNLVL